MIKAELKTKNPLDQKVLNEKLKYVNAEKYLTDQVKIRNSKNHNNLYSSFTHIEKYRYIYDMTLKLATEIGKCLSNQTRVQIMEWLKDLENNFPPHESLRNFDDGICVTHIKDKSGLSQSTISTYLTNMEKCGLLTMTRHGKWSYLKRNEKRIKEYTDFLR